MGSALGLSRFGSGDQTRGRGTGVDRFIESLVFLSCRGLVNFGQGAEIRAEGHSLRRDRLRIPDFQDARAVGCLRGNYRAASDHSVAAGAVP